MKVSKYDPDLFMYQYRGTLHGLLVTHADDFWWGEDHMSLLRMSSNHCTKSSKLV